MPYKIKWESTGTIVTYVGVVTYEEIRSADNAHYGDSRFDKSVFQINDLRKADMSKIPMKTIKDIAVHDFGSLDYKPKLKMAFVVLEGYSKKICEEYIYFSQQIKSTWQFEIFSDISEAYFWGTHEPFSIKNGLAK